MIYNLWVGGEYDYTFYILLFKVTWYFNKQLFCDVIKTSYIFRLSIFEIVLILVQGVRGNARDPLCPLPDRHPPAVASLRLPHRNHARYPLSTIRIDYVTCVDSHPVTDLDPTFEGFTFN